MSYQSTGAKFKTTKFSSKGLEGNSVKFFTSENFPLHIAGNFCMAQNFTVLADRSAATKISSANYGLSVGVVSPEH